MAAGTTSYCVFMTVTRISNHETDDLDKNLKITCLETGIVSSTMMQQLIIKNYSLSILAIFGRYFLCSSTDRAE